MDIPVRVDHTTLNTFKSAAIARLNPLLAELLKWFVGRLNRVNFLIGNIAVLLYAILTSILMNILGKSLIARGIDILLVIAFIVLGVGFAFSLGWRRLHDIGLPGQFLFLFYLIPVLNIFCFGVLVFFSGTEGKNQYGDVPRPEIDFDTIFETNLWKSILVASRSS